ncbi:adenylylsulfate kinase [Mucilaginibacter frigoritolerans]|uniref:Adenylyl-sulfate kinase n=1 Tax=Mucilaginibacter frigoritolerans TaxID=652788 RepID=A0A562TSQ7_9SPHI|nr:adenylyl-sulfate kinase [Mucilaginibacter frigoritolerans]TWI96224.1 adenylylsulfate kinase [Mucilaginibacter frigoritolerans]
MLIIQLTGLSGCGKTTLSNKIKPLFAAQNINIEILDGDQYRKTLCKDLGFSKSDRLENIRRLGGLAASLVAQYNAIIIAAINPYEEARAELKFKHNAKTVWINCELESLISRDTKGLYKRALLPDEDPDKIFNLTGVNDCYETPLNYDFKLDTHLESIDESAAKLYQFVKDQLK